MLFNSFAFLMFFPVVCITFFLLPKNRWRNLFLLIASYFFYMNWKPTYALLILTSTILTYGCGLLLERNIGNRLQQKRFLAISLVLNFSILFLFKYFNFAGDSITALFSIIGLDIHVPNLDVLLPVGISFYTFQAVGYSIDVYRGTIKAEKDFITYALFVSFFPQLVAGPIERAGNMLPQLHNNTGRFSYDEIRKGAFDILVGLFKKVVIADRLAIYVDSVYSSMDKADGLPATLGVIFFAFQLYLDFSAYSQIAVGTARIMGFRLTRNFNLPYMATTFREFWSRWHITLTQWFRDYLYIPLGGNRNGKYKMLLNVLIVFVISGLWHGASWNFVIWGVLNGLVYLTFTHVINFKPKVFWTKNLCRIFVVGFWILTLVFFRSETFSDAMLTFSAIGFVNVDNITSFGMSATELRFSIWMLVSILIMEAILNKHRESVEQFFFYKANVLRWLTYIVLILSTIYLGIYGVGSDASFIYFQS